MLLFKHINNEAIDEDHRIQREVMERIRKQIALLNPQPEQATESSLTRAQISGVNAKILSFANALNAVINEFDKRSNREESKAIIQLQEKYNNLVNYLNEIPLSNVAGSEKEQVLGNLDGYLPQLQYLNRLIQSYDESTVAEKQILGEMFNQFNDQTYAPIGAVDIPEFDSKADEAGQQQTPKQILEETLGEFSRQREELRTLDKKKVPREVAKKMASLNNKIIRRIEKLTAIAEMANYNTPASIKYINSSFDEATPFSAELADIQATYHANGAAMEEDTAL